MASEFKTIHTLPTRIFHWVIAMSIFAMIYSGMLIYWANDEYSISIGKITIIKFFPNWFYNFFDLKSKLSYGMAIHFSLIWIMSISVLGYFLYVLLTKRRKEFLLNKKERKGIFPYLKDEILFKKHKEKSTKYNPVQKLAYGSCIIMLFLVVVTGFAIYKPSKLEWLCYLLGGYKSSRIIHFICTLGLSGFIIIHIAQVIKYGFFMFLSIITGKERIKTEPTPIENSNE